MHIFKLFFEPKEHRSNSIHNTAKEEQHGANWRQNRHKAGQAENNTPAKCQVAGHRKGCEFLKINRI